MDQVILDHSSDPSSMIKLTGKYPNFIFIHRDNKNVLRSGNHKEMTEYIEIENNQEFLPLNGYFVSINRQVEGYSLFFYPSGQIGELDKFVNDMLEGRSIRWDKDGMVWQIENYVNNKLDGVKKEKVCKSRYMESTWRNGELIPGSERIVEDEIVI